MIQTFLAQGFVLSEHEVFDRLALELTNNNNNNNNNQFKRWNIVCERKEDLIAVRTQIFALLCKYQSEKHPNQPLKSWAGISLYTPDTLVRNFSLTLSNNSIEQLGLESHEQLRKPFIDIVEQEKLMRLLLLRLGYSLSDVAPLAKQILTLADTPLPPDESFLRLLLAVQSEAHSFKNIREIPDSSLRTICVAYQIAQKIFSSFVRLQSFVSTYWSTSFLQHVQAKISGDEKFKNFVMPSKFLSEPLLWIAAPEYCRSAFSYRPGNFQASVMDTLRDGLFSARRVWNENQVRKVPTWWARTQIKIADVTAESPKAHVSVLGSYAALTHHFIQHCENATADTQFILGDIDKRMLNSVRSDGSGVHSLTPHDFQTTNTDHLADTHWNSPAQEKVNQLRGEFQNYWQKLSQFDDVIFDALECYDLSPTLRQNGITFDLMLHRFFDSESFQFATNTIYDELPPALSFLPSLTEIRSFIVLGPPHSATSPSFHLRLLNAVFHHLRTQHIPLEPIASEEAYRGYWHSILSRQVKVEFLIRTLKELKNFPEDIRRCCNPPVQFNLWTDAILPTPAFERWLGDDPLQLHDEQWTRLLKPSALKIQQSSLSVTEFEDYVECPLQFYWITMHGVEQETQSSLQADAMFTGQRTHAMAEKLIRGLRQLALLSVNTETPQPLLWLKYFVSLQEQFIDSENFLSASPEVWAKGFFRALEKNTLTSQQSQHALAIVQEVTDVLFEPEITENEQSMPALRFLLMRETTRRAFRKLVQSELLEASSVRRVHGEGSTMATRAAFLEQPVDFQIHPSLMLTGRIDRIDTDPRGDCIIDYKTSKVRKNDPEIILDPRQLKSTNKLSVQGAIYSLAWSHRIADEDNRGTKTFSLLRLKTMDLSRDPYSTFHFASPLTTNSELYEELHTIYSRYADNLVKGDFSPRPINSDVCTWCALQNVCPAKGREGRS